MGDDEDYPDHGDDESDDWGRGGPPPPEPDREPEQPRPESEQKKERSLEGQGCDEHRDL